MRVAPHCVEHSDALLRCRRDIHILNARTAGTNDAAFLGRRHDLCIDRRMMCDDDIDIADVIKDLLRRLSCRRPLFLDLTAQEPKLLITRRFPVHACNLGITQKIFYGSLQPL